MPLTTSRNSVPPPKTLRTTLRKITETLARELAAPARSAPERSEVEWIIARAVAAMHGVSPLLSRTLRRLVLREYAAKSQTRASQSQWSRLSQSRRILRWIASRPTRNVTTHAVTAALTRAQ
jgi:hypothetical protein